MTDFKYTPDEDVKVHEEGAIRLLCRPFSSHEDGLPEWLKNSADAYAREDVPEARRVILVVIEPGRARAKAFISCLDLVGMTSAVIENDFRVWADPDAARRGARGGGVQGGHGNGGKCYMTQMFEEYAIVRTAKNGKGNCYGVRGGSVRFGYIPDRTSGRDYPVKDTRASLEETLRELRCTASDLPTEFREAVNRATGFTVVTGIGPRGYANQIPVRQLILNLMDHPQMNQTLQFCSVYVVVNGTPFNDGKPLRLAQIPPLEGGELPRVIPIPPTLKDPLTEQDVLTAPKDSPAGILTLNTSDKSMRWGRKARHNIVYRASSGFVGYIPVLELDVQSSYRDHIYGECHLESLEPFKRNERSRLAISPLARALESWISQRVEIYAEEFEKKERREYKQEEKDRLSKMNEALDRWKNRCLKEVLHGLWGPGEIGPRPPITRLPAGKPVRIDLSLSHSHAGIGVTFRPTLHFFDDRGRPIRSVPFRWISEDTNVALVDEDLMVINTFSYGSTRIWAETADGRVKSNKVSLEVARLLEIGITPDQIELPVGSRRSLQALCKLASGEETSDIYLVWTESNPEIARVSSSGLVFGFGLGQTEVVAGDDSCLARRPAVITVVAGEGKGRGDKPGRGFPRVLLSEVNPDPDTGEPVIFSREDPPVWQRPKDVDRNIWWINSAAPLARIYLDDKAGFGDESREWRMYMLERYVDVMVQIAFTHGPTELETLTVGDWLLRWGSQAARIQEAAAFGLREFIESGTLPLD